MVRVYHLRMLAIACCTLLLPACNITPREPEPEFLVTSQQREVLQQIVGQVTDTAAALPRSSLDRDQVEAFLRTHDQKLSDVLSEQQWQTYDESYRAWLANRIRRDVVRAHHRAAPRPPPSPGVQASGDSGDDRM